MMYSIVNFYDQLNESNNPLLLNEWKKIIYQVFGKETEIEEKKSLEAQISFGTDFIIKTKKGRNYSIDVKGRYESYPEWILELSHNFYDNYEDSIKHNNCLYQKPGWLYKSQANLILEGTIKNNKINEWVIFSIQPFKDDPSLISSLEKRYTKKVSTDGFHYWRTFFSLAPINYLKENAHTFYHSGDGLNAHW